MMIGIGTPSSQSRMPRPMGVSFPPKFLGRTSRTIGFGSFRGSGQAWRIECSAELTLTVLALLKGKFDESEDREK